MQTQEIKQEHVIEFNDWLMENIPKHSRYGSADFLNAFVDFINSKGYDIIRCSVAMRVVHPQIEANNYLWHKTEELGDFTLGKNPNIVDYSTQKFENGFVTASRFSLTNDRPAIFENSPLALVQKTGQPFRFCFAKSSKDDSAYDDFPVLSDLAKSNITDYAVIPIRLSAAPLIHQADAQFRLLSRQRSMMSFATNNSKGFDAHGFETLQKLAQMFAMRLERFLRDEFLSAALSAYLGRKTGIEVIAGRIKTGDIKPIESAIWFSDIRGYTQLAQKYSAALLIDWLNSYFKILIDAISRYDGEILKFMGDGLMAVFPLDAKRTAKRAVCSALLAARMARRNLTTLNGEREKKQLPAFVHGIGLHFGSAEYGNIGSDKRLDFTVIGSDVNLTARIAAKCSDLCHEVLLSSAAAEQIKLNTKLLGDFSLKGVMHSVKIYSLVENEIKLAKKNRLNL